MLFNLTNTNNIYNNLFIINKYNMNNKKQDFT